MNEKQEMSLDQYLFCLSKNHRAKRELSDLRARLKEAEAETGKKTTLCSRCNMECFDFWQVGRGKVCVCCISDMLEKERALADRLAEQLDQLQWVWDYWESKNGCYECPACGAEKVHGAAKHKPDCPITAALDEHAKRRTK